MRKVKARQIAYRIEEVIVNVPWVDLFLLDFFYLTVSDEFLSNASPQADPIHRMSGHHRC